jgi:SAM-dependent methyltransferase
MWRFLSDNERAVLLDSTRLHNNLQYAQPESYDRDHLRHIPASETKEGKIVNWVLNTYSPASVLEIGPGNGFYSRLFLDHASVKAYTAIDIVEPFIEYMRNNVIRGDDLSRAKLVYGNFLENRFDRIFYIIIFIASLNHIPNWVVFMKKFAFLLKKNGRIVFIEPRHGIPRIIQLFRKYVKHYHKKEFWINRNNFSSHHFLAFSEMKHIARACKLKISRLFFYSIIKGDKHLKNILKPKMGFFSCRHYVPLSLFAQFVYGVFEKDKHSCSIQQ